MSTDSQKKRQKPGKESYSTDLLGLGTACESVEDYSSDSDENRQIAGHSENLPHPEMKTAKFGHCPFCGGELIAQCRCPHSDSHCINGHEWHYDGKFIHAGGSNHASKKCCGGKPIAIVQ
jgi:hypothetical protein